MEQRNAHGTLFEVMTAAAIADSKTLPWKTADVYGT